MQVYPDWKILDFYVLHVLQNVMNLDALETTHVMSQYGDITAAIPGLGDYIAYDKCKYFQCRLNSFSKRLKRLVNL